MKCWICSDHKKCPYKICYEQDAESKKLGEEMKKKKQVKIDLAERFVEDANRNIEMLLNQNKTSE